MSGGVSAYGPYEFILDGLCDSYLMMNSLHLETKFKVTRSNGDDLDAEEDDVGVINLIGQSLWRAVDVSLNGESILIHAIPFACSRSHQIAL